LQKELIDKDGLYCKDIGDFKELQDKNEAILKEQELAHK
jgi:hypothetical protein